MATIEQIKKLRAETGISISDCREALEKTGGNLEKAKEILKEKGQTIAQDRKEKETSKGIIDAYIHSGKRIGVMIEINCESDFVARSEDFQKLAHELCLQIAALSPEEIPLMEQPWIKDEKKTIKDLIEEYIAKFGENIILKQFTRYEL